MHTFRNRLAEIVATFVFNLLLAACLAAFSTIARDLILHPRPVVNGLEVSASPICVSRTPLSRFEVSPGANPMNHWSVVSSVYMVNGKLEPNIELVRLETQRNQWVMVRTTDRMYLRITGTADFSRCWDWNTKAIYVSFLARYTTPQASVNEVMFLDAIIRHVTVPWELRAFQHKSMEEMTSGERRRWRDFERNTTSAHDARSVYIDHVHRKIVFEGAMKYPMEDYTTGFLAGREVEIVMRYQVMSYSGWAPIREKIAGGRIVFNASTEVTECSESERWVGPSHVFPAVQ